jgi:HIV Tat-specific factor 1
VFSKAGVLLIGDDGQPRIKMYNDDEGKFKGDALVMYFKEGSVDLAITLLDDTELEMGAGYGNMRVRVAEYDKAQASADKKEKADKVAADAGAKDGEEGEGKEEVKKRKPPTAEEKKQMSKRIRRMQE